MSVSRSGVATAMRLVARLDGVGGGYLVRRSRRCRRRAVAVVGGGGAGGRSHMQC